MENYKNIDVNLQSVLNYFADGLQQFIDFGIQIIDWDLQLPNKSDEHLPPILFLRNFVENVDAISILIRNSSIDPCKGLMRTILENLVYIEYILEKETSQRSLSYIVWNTMNQNKWAYKSDGKSPEFQNIRNTMKKDKYLNNNDFPIYQESETSKANSEELLRMDKYNPIYLEFERTKKTLKNPQWYSLFHGPKNIQKIFEHLEMHMLYEVFYRAYSGSVHGNDIIQGKIFGSSDGKSSIAQIRFPKNAQAITQNCCLFCCLTFKNYIDKRLPERQGEYKTFYLSIQKFFMGLNKKQYIDFTKPL